MIPANIKNFLQTILEKSELGEIQWHEHEDEVFIRQQDYSLSLKFDFDADQEIPYFRISYGYKEKDITIFENFYESDYGLISNIFKSAKSSKLDFPF